MKVLFISSGNSGDIRPMVKNQGDSLFYAGLDVGYFLIKGSGLRGYLSNIKGIRREFRNNGYDLVHVHYGLSAFFVSLAGRFPSVVSLMGSDVYQSRIARVLIRLFSILFWDFVIVKTERMNKLINIRNSVIIPNGVDLTKLKILERDLALRRIGHYPPGKKLVLFISDPLRKEKNFDLARKAISLADKEDLELLTVYNVPNEQILNYLNAADLLLVTSLWEGSINVVKEAMACNCPIVSTDVGDVKYIIGDTEGCFISSFEPADVAHKIRSALYFGGRTCGRNRIIELGLDSGTIGNKLVEVYKMVLNSYQKH